MNKLFYDHFTECLDDCCSAIRLTEADSEFEEAKLANCRMYLETVRGIVDALYKISGGNGND